MNPSVELYEDNAGGLAVLHDGQVYRGLEFLEDGTTFSDFAAILAGVTQDMTRFESEHVIDERFDKLVARWCPMLKLEIVGRLGIVGQRFVGEEE